MDRMWSPEQIKQLRNEAGMTLAAFGKQFDVSESTVYYWESGKNHPRYEMFLKIGDFADKLRGKRLAGAGS